MNEKVIRFGITDAVGMRAATWRLWVQQSKYGEEIYLACRELGGAIHTSFHPTGEWHTAYSPEAHRKLNHNESEAKIRKKIVEWPKPPEVQPGMILAHKILTPGAAVTTPLIDKTKRKIIHIPAATAGYANETMIIIVAPDLELEIKNANLIDFLSLEDGGKIIIVDHVIPMPKWDVPPSGTPRYFDGKSKADLVGGNLRAIVFADDHNGHRMIVDTAVATPDVS